MRRFARLYAALDETTATGEKVAALVEYFSSAPPADAAWAVHFLVGRRPKRLVSSRQACRVGGRRRRTSPPGCSRRATPRSAIWRRPSRCCCRTPARRATGRWPTGWSSGCSPCEGRTTTSSARRCSAPGASWTAASGCVWNKLITGAFRVGASARLVERALAIASDVPEGVIAHRLMGGWEPTPEFFARLIAPDLRDADVSRPYPFYLAYPLEGPLEALGRARGVAGRVEVGRHPVAADPPSRPNVPLVPRRGAADRAIPRGGRDRRGAPRRHRHRRRDAALVGRDAPAFRADAAADRAEGAGPEDSERGAGLPRRLRPAGGGRIRPARAAARRAAAETREPGRGHTVGGTAAALAGGSPRMAGRRWKASAAGLARGPRALPPPPSHGREAAAAGPPADGVPATRSAEPAAAAGGSARRLDPASSSRS